MVFVEIYKNRELVKRIKNKDILDGFRWSNELMSVPSTSIKLPITYREFLNGHDEIKIFINNKVFWGIIKKVVEDKVNEVLTVSLDHIVAEWEYRQISVNNAVKDGNINVVYKGAKTNRNGEVAITASDFMIYRQEIGMLSDEEYVLRAGASAWTPSGESVEITVDDSQIEYRDGEWPVTFCARGVCVTVTCTTRDNPKDVESTYYKMTAHNFVLPVGGINLSDAEYIALAGVTIELTDKGREKGMPIPPIQVDRSSVRDRDGAYSVRFFAEYEDPEEEDPYYKIKEVSITVTVIVQGDNFADPTIADNIADIFADMNFAHPGWRLNYAPGAGEQTIEYVYSRQNKLQALTKTLELTKDLFWRVRFVNERVMDISPFGDLFNHFLTTRPSSHIQTRLITEPKITHEYDHVINCVTVYSEKSDTGVSSMTLREIYNNPALQEPGFPVVILRANVNNERDYRAYADQPPVLAPNNWLEYAVIDEESVALESGHLIEASFAFNDLSPFAQEVEEIDKNTHEIADEDRIKAAKIAYAAAIRKLKQARRRYEIEFTTEELPPGLNVGDKVRLLYNNKLLILEDCSRYEEMVLAENDIYYVIKMDYDIGLNGAEVDTVTLSKEIRVYDRDEVMAYGYGF